MSSFRNRFRRTTNTNPSSSSTHSAGGILSRSTSRSNSNHNHTYAPLATFDACIEACDALAAASAAQVELQRRFAEEGGHNINDGARDVGVMGDMDTNNDGDGDATDARVNDLPDCSVLVSPDGALLFTSQSAHEQNTNTNSSACAASNIASSSNYNSTTQQQQQSLYPWTHISPSQRDGIILNEEYQSAIITGNDRTPHGDYDSNGFSARGWDVNAASLALRSCHGVLQGLEGFVEELALIRKEEGVKVMSVCGKFGEVVEGVRSGAAAAGGKKKRHQLQQQKDVRVGPILVSGSSLSVAMEKMEEYYSICAETDAEQWRKACSDSHLPSLLPNNTTAQQQQSDGTGEIVSKDIDPMLIQGILPKLRIAVTKANTRVTDRETALNEIRSKVGEAENTLRKQKEWAAIQWTRVREENANIDRIYQQKVNEQTEFMKNARRQEEAARLEQPNSDPNVSEADIWEMVKGVSSMEDFEHTGYSPQVPRKSPTKNPGAENDSMLKQVAALSLSPMSRSEIEKLSDIHDMRTAAIAADELVEDAAGSLLNVMSKQDTTMRSARVASEACLLSECNAAHDCLRSLVAIERAALEKRTQKLKALEAAVEAIDVRKDIDSYIQKDKLTVGGSSRARDDDDGGIAAALAVLNSHGDGTNDNNRSNIERPICFRGWSEGGDSGGDDEIDPDYVGDTVRSLFKDDTATVNDGGKSNEEGNDAVSRVCGALMSKSYLGHTGRQAVLYELNNQRSIKTEVKDIYKFNALCQIFNAFLSGCGSDGLDVSNTKMLMILSQTFYFDGGDGDENRSARSEPSTKERKSRVYVKNKISGHRVWTEDDFW